MTPLSEASFNTVFQSNVNGRIVASANMMPEAQAFFSEYPDGIAQVDRTGNEIDGPAVKYSYEKVYGDGKVNKIRMFVMINDTSGKPTGQVYLSCAVWYVGGLGGMSTSPTEQDIAKALQTTDCAK